MKSPPIGMMIGLGFVTAVAACGSDTDDGTTGASGISVVSVNASSSAANGSGGSGGTAGQGGSSSNAGGQGGGTSPSPEDCYDGIDNDQNGATDCTTPDPACAAVCADTCAAPKVIADPSGVIVGDTTEHATLSEGASCAATMNEHGPAHVYEVTVSTDGVLEATLTSKHDLTLSIRTDCADNSNELACSERVTGEEDPYNEFVKVNAAPGDKRFVVVEGYSLLQYGQYELDVSSRPIVCGDAKVDPPEECDDSNTIPGDGCDASCKLEATETEPNDLSTQAQKYAEPWFASISTVSDVDWVWFNLGNNYSVLINTFDLGSGNCSLGLMDTAMELYQDPNVAAIASDDDSGDGLCAKLSVRGLSGGTYYLKTTSSATPKALPPWAYYLYVEMDECGNGQIGGAEECDDNNTMDGDGCSSICENENP